MDWFTVVLILLFFVLPVIQQVLEQARRQERGELPDSEEFEAEPDEIPDARPARLERGRTRAEGTGWSDDWTPWPTLPQDEPEEQEDAEDAVPNKERDPTPVSWAPAPPPQRKEPAPTTESVDRPERKKLQVPSTGTVLPERIDQPAPLVRPTARMVARPSPSESYAQRRSSRPSQRDLGSPAALRRAVILKEILSPPVALRPDREERSR